MEPIETRHRQFVFDLLRCSPLGERARELRTMILRLERIKPELEMQRIEAMKVDGCPITTLGHDVEEVPTIAVSGRE
jgi:hypothetical protein